MATGEYLDIGICSNEVCFGLDNISCVHLAVFTGNGRHLIQDSTNLGLLFHKEGVETLIGNGQGRIHAGHAPSDDKAVGPDG